MRKEDVIRRLRGAAEIAYMKHRLLFATALFGSPCLLLSLSKYGPGLSAVLTFLIPYAVILGFHLWRLYRIFSKPESYLFCQCLLDQPHADPNLNGIMYFTVTLELPGGTAKTVDTHSVFALRGIAPLIFEEYVNKTATIAYNPETGMVVVIG